MKQAPRSLSAASSGQDKQHQILDAFLAQVPFDGWTESAFGRALQDCTISRGEADLLFPSGVRDVADFFGMAIDEAVQTRIQKDRGFIRLRVREKIAFAIRAQLEFLTPYREAVRRLMIWYIMPFHWSLGMKRLYRIVDLAWQNAGDTSTDFNFYTKRGLLAGVVKTTFLFWLDDETPGCHASWEFLDRRIADILRIGQTIGKFRN